MSKIYRLENSIQHYAWGDKNILFDLFDIANPKNEPQAEIWMGAHPKAPSYVVDEGEKISLVDFIAQDPQAILGEKVALAFDNQLPFLYKVLAAKKPLSIQSHPSLAQAKKGFAKESREGIALDAAHRNYKDSNHKPELICALTTFKALNGFRSIEDIIALLSKIASPLLEDSLSALKLAPDQTGLKTFFCWLMNMPAKQVEQLTTAAIKTAKVEKGETAFETLLFLHSYYPNDIGIMCAIMLNIIELKPGEAMYLEAGELHAYLNGVGMEIMANSDNVLRGGLTPKHIDNNELLATLSFTSGPIDVLTAKETAIPSETTYITPAKEFAFAVIETQPESAVRFDIDSIEILFCADGAGQITSENSEMSMVKGHVYLIPASVVSYRISGKVKIFKGSVPSISNQPIN